MADVVFSNPSLHFRRVDNCDVCTERISQIDMIVDRVEMEGRTFELKFKCEEIGQFPNPYRRFQATKTWKGILSVDEKTEKLFREERMPHLSTYNSHFYIIETESPGIMVLKANSPIARRTWKVLSDRGISHQQIRFEEQLQSALLNQPDIIKYGSLVADETSDITGEIRVRGQTPTSNITNDEPTQFAERRGPRKALGLTLSAEQRITFWVYRGGKILIHNPNVTESVVHDLIDRLLSSL